VLGRRGQGSEREDAAEHFRERQDKFGQEEKNEKKVKKKKGNKE
jgi:hypothetical protein